MYQVNLTILLSSVYPEKCRLSFIFSARKYSIFVAKFKVSKAWIGMEVQKEVQKLLVWYMKEKPCKRKARSEFYWPKQKEQNEQPFDCDSDAETLVVAESEDEEYAVSAIIGPYLDGAGHLFAERITWFPTWEPVDKVTNLADERVTFVDRIKKRVKVKWDDDVNGDISEILHMYPTSISTHQIDSAWRQAVSLNSRNATYSPFDKTGKEKARSNQNFADSVRNLACDGGAVVYLEESTANTTRYLRPITDKQLVAVNFDPVVLSGAIVRSDKCNLMTFSGSLAAYLTNCTKDSIAALFADYCGTFAGNATGTSPAFIDLPLLFGKKLLKDGSVFAMVVCTRLRVKSILKNDIIPFIIDLARRNGYAATLSHSFSYGSMLSIQFDIRVPSIC